MKNLILFLLLFYCSSGMAQNTQFSNIYDMIYGHEQGNRLLSIRGGYIVGAIGACADKEGGIICSTLRTIGKKGDLVKNIIFEKHLKLSPIRSFHDISDTIYICGADKYASPYKWRVYKTNSNLDSLGGFEKSYFGEKNMSLDGMEVKGDYLYLIGCEMSSWGYRVSTFWIVKTDKQGNVIKRGQMDDLEWYEIDNTEVDMVKTKDGNFVVSYSTLTDNLDPQRDDYRLGKIVKFDENLDVIWLKEFSKVDVSIEGYGNMSDVAATSDSGVVFTWTVDILEMYYDDKVSEDFAKTYGELQTTIQKLDKDGNLLWSDKLWSKRTNYGHGASPMRCFSEIIEAKNGDIIGVGRYSDYLARTQNAWISRYSKDGKLLWEKIYDDDNIEGEVTSFFDIVEEDNGDLVMSGRIAYDNKVPQESFAWLVRLDSMGCFEPGCGIADTMQLVYTSSGYISETEELITDYSFNNGIMIYPNPARDYIKVVLTKPDRWSRWQIIDISGSVVDSGTYRDMQKIDISNLHTGMYILKMTDKEGFVSVGKFVVE